MTATGNLIYTVLVASGLVGAAMTHTVPLMPRPGLERYYEVESVTADRVGNEVHLHVDRAIHAPITMSYSIRVFQMTHSGAVLSCVAQGGPFRYRPDAVLPNPVTLDWWTGGHCPEIPPGQAQIETTWDPIIPDYKPITVTTEVAP
jgi:hypothetical protein